ncbi:replication associated, partial [Olea europaea subsp. europaea]
SAHFHPNIRRARSSSDVNNYISKYGDFIEDGSFQIDGRSARGCPSAVADVYAEALNATSKIDAMTIIKGKDPK